MLTIAHIADRSVRIAADCNVNAGISPMGNNSAAAPKETAIACATREDTTHGTSAE